MRFKSKNKIMNILVPRTRTETPSRITMPLPNYVSIWIRAESSDAVQQITAKETDY
jgi:hypothetical protein